MKQDRQGENVRVAESKSLVHGVTEGPFSCERMCGATFMVLCWCFEGKALLSDVGAA